MRAMSPEVLVPAEHAGNSEEGVGTKSAAVVIAAVAALCMSSAAFAAGGTIKGRISFAGPEPGNRVIRMGMDPMCAAVNRGKQVVNEIYQVGDKNALGSVFVKIEGTFPATPVPSTAVEIDQSACIYRPRVVGAR